MRLFLSFALLAVLSLISLQRAFAQNFVGKLIVGINANQVDGDGLSGYNKPGLLIGVGAAFPINEKWSFEPEMLYSQKGSRASQAEQDLGSKFIIYRLNYIELPLVINYAPVEFFVVQAGLHPNVLVAAKIDPGDNQGFIDYLDSYKRLDLCGSGGLELRFRKNLAFNMRLSYSVFSARKLEEKPAFAQGIAGFRVGQYNNSVSFSLRYLLKAK
jgi:hypothetical protein